MNFSQKPEEIFHDQITIFFYGKNGQKMNPLPPEKPKNYS
jgi:hypothetical protein